jgi:hypothetical protein
MADVIHSEVRVTSADGTVTYVEPYTYEEVIEVQNTRRRVKGLKGFVGGFEGFVQGRRKGGSNERNGGDVS